MLFGPVPIDLVITRSDSKSPNDNGVTATLSSKANKASKTFELANPVVPSAEVVTLALGKDAPPTIEVRLTGGADGSSYHFMCLFSLIDDEVFQTFAADYEDNSYFRRGACGELMKQTDDTYQLVEETVLKLKLSTLLWNKKLKRFEPTDSKNIPTILTTLALTKLHATPSFKVPPVKKADKGTAFTALATKDCDQKLDGDACSMEPFEKAR